MWGGGGLHADFLAVDNEDALGGSDNLAALQVVDCAGSSALGRDFANARWRVVYSQRLHAALNGIYCGVVVERAGLGEFDAVVGAAGVEGEAVFVGVGQRSNLGGRCGRCFNELVPNAHALGNFKVNLLGCAFEVDAVSCGVEGIAVDMESRRCRSIRNIDSGKVST